VCLFAWASFLKLSTHLIIIYREMMYCTTISSKNECICFNWQQKEGYRNSYSSTGMYIYYFVYTSLHVFPSWKSVDSKVENKSDTIHRNLKNKLNAIKKRKRTTHPRNSFILSLFKLYCMNPEPASGALSQQCQVLVFVLFFCICVL
jgi:hypothetical protein